jgi:hypothetical protein
MPVQHQYTILFIGGLARINAERLEENRDEPIVALSVLLSMFYLHNNWFRERL